MLPLLDVARDQEDHRLIDAVDLLADRLRLTDDERRKRSSEGQQTRFYHSVFLARKHLTKSGLLEDPVRGQFRITELGRRVLESGPSQIDRAYLRQIEESGIATIRETTSLDPEPNTATTPEEALQDAYETLRNSLADELLGQVKQASPAFFELLVVDVLVRMGYGGSRKDAGEAIGQSGDEGIDGIIKEDRLGLDIIYIQAKRWSSTVGRPEVQRFAGALQGKRARKGVFITTSSFSREAVQFANSIETKVILVDGRQLAALMIDHGVGVRTDASYELKRIDSDYFPE
ncbi:MAG: restriction endonuclease [Bryobacterales bacterium]|nr:restriction endonuclease [Bryobacterales bacterium]MDE0621920.1 restriction endonuclease [Bryobacterales bacterium]